MVFKRIYTKEQRLLRLRYREHRANAQARGIGFKLTFDEWLSIWSQSGKMPNRDNTRDGAVMARFGDKGFYEVGNVKIITRAENSSEGNVGKVLTLKQREAVRKAQTGNRHRRILDNESVLYIQQNYRKYTPGYGVLDLAREFGVSGATIHNIITHKYNY